MAKILNFPSHKIRYNTISVDSALDSIEVRYEATFGEPWGALEARVRARHPDFFALYDNWIVDEIEPKKWWQIWK